MRCFGSQLWHLCSRVSRTASVVFPQLSLGISLQAWARRATPNLGVARPSPTLAGIEMGSGMSTLFGVLADPRLTGRPSSRLRQAAAGKEQS